MGLFDKVTKTAATIGQSTLNSAAKVGSNVGVAAQDQSELAGLKMQLNAVNQELDASYVQVGRKYVDYVIASGQMPGVDVSSILKLMEPKLEQKQALQAKIVALEKKIKDQNILREREMAEAEFLREKDKLDKALQMDVLSQADYDLKVAAARRKLDNFEEIKRVEKQYEMKLITREEFDAKMRALTM